MKTTNHHPTYGGEATILDRAEFARLIRKDGHLRVTLFVKDRSEVLMDYTACAGFNVPAKKAVEKLNAGDLDAFEWVVSDDGTPRIWHYAAPLHVQQKRRVELLERRQSEHADAIARIEAAIAAGNCDPWRRDLAESRRRSLMQERAEIERLQAQLAARIAQPAAA